MLLRRRLLLLFVAILAGVLALGATAGFVIRERDDAQQRERELSVAMSFDLYEKLDDASLRAHLAEVALHSGARDPVIERYRAYQRLDVEGKR